MVAFSDLKRPVLTDLLGFAGRKDANGSQASGMQGAHVSSEKVLGERLEELFTLLKSDLLEDSDRRIDINGNWNGGNPPDLEGMRK